MVFTNWFSSVAKNLGFGFAQRRQKQQHLQVEHLEERALPTAAMVDVAPQVDSFAHMYADLAQQGQLADSSSAHARAISAKSRSPGNQTRTHVTVTPGASGEVQANEIRTAVTFTLSIQKGRFIETGARYVGQNLVGNVRTATLSIWKDGQWEERQTIAVNSNTLSFTDFGEVADSDHNVKAKIDLQFGPTLNEGQMSGHFDLLQGRKFPMRHAPQFTMFEDSNLPDTTWNRKAVVNNPTLNITGTTMNQGQTSSIMVGISGPVTSLSTATLNAGNGLVFTATNSNTMTIQFAPGGSLTQSVSVTALTTGSINDATVPVTAASPTLGLAAGTVTVRGTGVVNNPTLNITGTTLIQGQSGPVSVGISAPVTTLSTVTLNAGNGLVFTANNSSTLQIQFAPGDSLTQSVSVTALNTGSTSDVIVPVTGTSTTLGSAAANVTVKGTGGGGGVHNVTWDVVIAVSTSGPIKIQGVFFDHTYANRGVFAIADITPQDGDVETRLGQLVTTDANGAGAITFTPTVVPQNGAFQVRALGTSAETLDRAENVVIVVIADDGRVYQLKEGHGLTWNAQIGCWFMDISQGILQP